MNNDDIKAWRKTLGFTQDQAATALGVSKATVVNYEAGIRREDGRPVVIPKSIALACAAIAAGLAPWRSPPVTSSSSPPQE